LKDEIELKANELSYISVKDLVEKVLLIWLKCLKGLKLKCQQITC